MSHDHILWMRFKIKLQYVFIIYLWQMSVFTRPVNFHLIVYHTIHSIKGTESSCIRKELICHKSTVNNLCHSLGGYFDHSNQAHFLRTLFWCITSREKIRFGSICPTAWWTNFPSRAPTREATCLLGSQWGKASTAAAGSWKLASQLRPPLGTSSVCKKTCHKSFHENVCDWMWSIILLNEDALNVD